MARLSRTLAGIVAAAVIALSLWQLHRAELGISVARVMIGSIPRHGLPTRR